MNQQIKSPHIFVVGNEKGGAGKTTCSMHLIAGMMDKGLKVASIDTDCRQSSLTRYLQHRETYNYNNSDKLVPVPKHFLITESLATSIVDKEEEEGLKFNKVIGEARDYADVIVIDTPGSYSFLSRLAHSYADTIVTPINDSFLDIDVMAKVSPDDLSVVEPSIYSQMIWEQKIQRAKRDRGLINWIVMRNRLSNIDAANKRNVSSVLDRLSKRISFEVAPGFSERVIFRELFLQGLTLFDLTHANYSKSFSISHVAARQELREFFKSLKIDEILQSKV